MFRMIAVVLSVVTLSVGAPAAAAVVDPGDQVSTFRGNTLGYYFTAPQDMVITGLFVPANASTRPFDVAVLSIDSLQPAPTPGSVFSILYTERNQRGPITGLSIALSAGQTVGILGSRGRDARNSLATVSPTVDVLGTPVTLNRLAMSDDLRVVDPTSATLFSENAQQVGRIRLEV